ncbi:MAG: rhodanese-like domain-containing protein, partial [Rhodospirillaceae bacterium]
MSYANPDALVSTEWLAQHMNAPDVHIVDASWFLPNDGRKGIDAYNEAHIPGAVFFDIDEIADTDSGLPHMLPSPEKFSSRVRKLGLGDGTRIVVYDANGGYMAACRVWWTFRVFGHEDVAVLDGGLPKWLAEGRPAEDLPTTPQERHFTARQNNFLVRDAAHLIANCDSGTKPSTSPSKET